mgnify:CR=1 FL=1
MAEAPLGVLAWTSGLLLVLSVLFTVLSALIERSGPVRVRHWVEEANGRLRRLYDAPRRFEAYRFLLSVLAKGAPLALALAVGLLLDALGAAAPYLLGFVSVLVLVAAVEATNRLLVSQWAEQMLDRLTPIYQALLVLLAPLVTVTAPLLPSTVKTNGDDGEDEEDEEASDEEIEAFIDFGTREGILEPEEGKLLWGIVDFGDTVVRSVMTPRIDGTFAAIDTPPEELVGVFLDSGHSRIPLYDGSIDRIAGILHIRDLLRTLNTPEHPAVRTLAKPPFIVPETKPLDELLREMQAKHQQMAVVVDEYGGTSGVVTVEDLLEEIVGEIDDEHEVETPDVEHLPDGSVRLDGRVHVETLEEEFDVELDEDVPYETVGGMVFAVVGDVPEVGQVVTWNGLRIQVEGVIERRVKTVRVERLPERPVVAEEA